MADFQLIKQEIDDNVNTNGVGAITGAILNTTLNDMVDAINAAKADAGTTSKVVNVLDIEAIPVLDVMELNAGDIVLAPIAHATTAWIVAYKRSNAVNLVNFTTTTLEIVKYDTDGLYDETLTIKLVPDTYNENDLAAFDADGNIIDSDINISDIVIKSQIYSDLGFNDFDDTATYSVGDIVVYSDGLYVFTASHTGAWSYSDVQPADLFRVIEGKQDVISDLSTIRSGAAAGATAVQPGDLATVATSGSYNDLLNKPTIPAAQVNSDWNANSGVAQILNKPTIPDVSGKADKVVGANSGDVATLDGSGNLTDSGLSVFDFFVMVEDASTPPASMAPNNVYQYGTLAGNTTFPPLATPTEPDIANVYCWTFATPATAPTITWPVAITDWAGGSAPTINASKKYEVSVMDGLATIIEA